MSRFVISLVAMLGAVSSMLLLGPEWTANQQSLLSQRSFVENIESGAVASMAPARSIRVQKRQMQNCTDWQYNTRHAFYPPETQTRLAQVCSDGAARILERTPTTSAAWMALAISHWNLSDAPAALKSLARAQETGRHEGWMSVRRLDIALRIGFDDQTEPALRTEALTLGAREMPALFDGNRMVDQLVGIYQRAPWARDWFTERLEEEPPGIQRQFLRRLRAAS